MGFRIQSQQQGHLCSNRASNEVLVIDSATNKVIKTIPVGEYPRYLEYNPGNKAIYVTNDNSDDVSVINSFTNTVIKTIPVGNGPLDLEYNPDNGYIYVTNGGSDDVSVISGSVVIKTIPVGEYPQYLEYNPSNKDIYVVNTYSEEASVIDSATNTVIKTIPVGDHPWYLEYNPSNNAIYIVNHDTDDVSVISGYTNKVIKTIPVGDGPGYLEYNPSNKYMYTANTYSDDVSVIGSYTIIIGPAANAGLNLKVDSGSVVQLDGSNSNSNLTENMLSYQWTQIGGPVVTLDDPRSVKPTFKAPETESTENIVFSLVVINDEGVRSEPDEVKITVNPTRFTTSEDDESRTLSDEITGILKNPLNITNSIGTADRLRDILRTDN